MNGGLGSCILRPTYQSSFGIFKAVLSPVEPRESILPMPSDVSFPLLKYVNDISISVWSGKPDLVSQWLYLFANQKGLAPPTDLQLELLRPFPHGSTFTTSRLQLTIQVLTPMQIWPPTPSQPRIPVIPCHCQHVGARLAPGRNQQR